MTDSEVPEWVNPDDAARLFVENRGGRVQHAALDWRDRHQLAPASSDRFRIAVLGIDAQVAFCHPDAEMFVPGAVEDSSRLVTWLYRNLEQLTQLCFSLDTHALHQVFHAPYWVGAEGQHPAPFTIITAADLRSRRWSPSRETDRAWALDYCERLAASGRYELTIWPLHALLGGTQNALMPVLMEAAMFHGIARNTAPQFVIKGEERRVESYSVFCPEVQELSLPNGTVSHQGTRRQELIDQLLAYDRLYVFGQAASHCVLATLRDLVADCQARGRQQLLTRVHLLTDATSPVPAPDLQPLPPELDFPRIAELGFAEFAATGIQLCRTTDPVEVPA